MIRLATEDGWWLVTHPDHARLAGAFAERWGNQVFRRPEPRRQVMLGIRTHDDGWAVRDAAPQITRQGLPAAFSVELVGRYSAFEEIDLADYLAVRERAVAVVAELDPYAALLVSLHTYNLLARRADRSTIAAEQLPLLDAFLERQRGVQQELYARAAEAEAFSAEELERERIGDHFRLLQATDNLSLLACVDYREPATLLHPLPLVGGGRCAVTVESVGERRFRLAPYPFDEAEVSLGFPARHVVGKSFGSAEELQAAYAGAEVRELMVTVCGEA
jgi:Protein of unknown function (DUF3891)